MKYLLRFRKSNEYGREFGLYSYTAIDGTQKYLNLQIFSIENTCIYTGIRYTDYVHISENLAKFLEKNFRL